MIRKALLLTFLLTVGSAHAGGPLLLRNDGVPFVWSTAAPISYRTDNGPLSGTINEATARTRVQSMFNVWQNVSTSSISYARVGSISAVGAFSGGDVNTPAEFEAVAGDCDAGNQSPVIYDANGSILVDLGIDETSVIGFAGPCATNATQILTGLVVMNGLFQDGAASPVADLTAAQFDAAIIHEIGHLSGLDHSQINLSCLSPCGADDLAGLPTMFPFLVHDSQGSLSTDDIAWISRLYPQTAGGTTFAGTHGTITGVVYFSDGESHVQLANVIARRVDTGDNEDRRFAVSVVSGYKFRVFHGNPITNSTPSQGSESPGDIGLFEIPVPAGNYMLEVESIWFEFIGGSSVGPGIIIEIPGNALTIGPINIAAGAIVSGVDIVLLNTPPRFDQFESP